ncbi:hypothetical protein A8B79_10845 [Balneola sp. EhC07]|jgi:uncharacterized membrane protein|uniref:anthrone oxygenase family protein n=1 Tax=Balneola sp. EhC07 TaxID=1849360 RepID=UPI0007F3A78E|nr:DUF1772 domain-containing protein [Balneola sp. EhC07]OAN60433.1 hypothetical protein A8B79_10845 [Balneola sp. EhC07]
MDLLQITFITATVLCSLVAGFLLAFSLVVMPGIKNLDDRNFLKAFREMDLIIQNNNPIFMIVWVGSVLSIIALVIQGVQVYEGYKLLAVLAITVFSLLGVQLPTASINIPLNNRVQKLDLETLDEVSLKIERDHFERRWNRSNIIRTIFAVLTSTLLVVF